MTRLVYILAASHSGSTLLAMLMGRHPEVCSVGELKATWLGQRERYRCSCRELILECPFWRAVSARMNTRGFGGYDVTDSRTDFSSGMSPYVRRFLRPLHRGCGAELVRDAALMLSPGWRRGLPEIQKRNAALAASLLELSKKKVLVDSSKTGVRLKYLLRNPELDVRVVKLVRDGRGVALTYTDASEFADARDPDLRNGGVGHVEGRPRRSLAQAAREWRRSNEEAEALVRRLSPDRWIEIRYEQLCASPTATLRKIFRFIDVDSSEVSLDFRSADHHVVGNGMRLDSTSTIELDERWRSVLSSGDLALFDTVAGPLSRSLGYL